MTDKDPRECKYAFVFAPFGKDIVDCRLNKRLRPCKMWKHGWNCSKFTPKEKSK